MHTCRVCGGGGEGEAARRAPRERVRACTRAGDVVEGERGRRRGERPESVCAQPARLQPFLECEDLPLCVCMHFRETAVLFGGGILRGALPRGAAHSGSAPRGGRRRLRGGAHTDRTDWALTNSLAPIFLFSDARHAMHASRME